MVQATLQIEIDWEYLKSILKAAKAKDGMNHFDCDSRTALYGDIYLSRVARLYERDWD